MKILFIVPYTPNFIRVRPYNLIRFLSQRGNEVWVYTLWTSEEEKQNLEMLKTHVFRVESVYQSRIDSIWNSFKGLFSNEPLQSVYSWNKRLFAKIQEALEKEKFDVIHVEHLRGSKYGLRLKEIIGKQPEAPPIIWDSVDCITILFRQAIAQGKGVFAKKIASFDLKPTTRMEQKLIRLFDKTLVTSKLDREALLEEPGSSPAADVQVLPNGVDLAFFRPDPSIQREESALIVSGKMSYHANQAMVDFLFAEIMPLIWEKKPEVKLWIVGKDPPAEIKSIQSERVIVTGTVPDLRPYLYKASIAVAPVVYGAGIQNKVLEAMACAVPMVCTSKAVSALSVVPGRDLLTADSASGFAGNVLELLEDREKQQRIGQSGLEYVKSNHDWEKIVIRLEEIYQAAMKKS